ncbi:Putative proteasome component (PCI) domain, tetratricopeptide-like helical domain superfamily [Septoria linicola]|uniref:COP9 signalosome complex subunit 4 n=1 Tax=Septoria linicola TaxID=215465 RepID=A0A9Q9EDK1_9PEZI|nr:putative proteasome component (PCI) domain, tetratricopeptide-like helical domain superfamily [Septoria linicola]USW46890.1 Putative proteasome component (PCI) domain, tetratricopeptide-like helical domain superfamily [Septoria linicola]
MAPISAQLSALEQASGNERAQGYSEALQQITTSDADIAENLVAYVQSISSDAVGVINSRPLLSSFVEQFRTLSDEVKLEAGPELVQILQPKVVSFEQQDTEIKLILADAYEADDDFTNSAKTLQMITLESSQRSVSDDEKAKIWMRVCRCYLEEDDPTNATSYLNKIKQISHNITNNETRLQFQLSQARISDSQRNFLDAAQAYYTLSNEGVIDEEERLQALSAAITCAVLAPAGPQRGKQLAKIYKDDRAADVAEFGILEKIFLDRLLSPSEVAAFAANLKEHQLAKTSDGSTVLDKAVLEHNLLAVSRIYANITIENLGKLLGVDSDRAEAYASAMIQSNRLSGSIDQIAEIIHFNSKEPNDPKIGLRLWDHNVQGLAESVEGLTTMLQREEPQWYDQQLAA